MDAPEILPSDFAKFERPAQLHIAFQALSHYVKKHGALPKPRCQVSLDHSPSWYVCGLVCERLARESHLIITVGAATLIKSVMCLAHEAATYIMSEANLFSALLW